MSTRYICNHYQLKSPIEATQDINIALLGDLHNAKFNGDFSALVADILKENPNIICITGDMCDRKSSSGSNFIELLKTLKKANDKNIPIYFCEGNHEIAVKTKSPTYYLEFLEKIKELGVVVLNNNHVDINLNGSEVSIYGLLTRGNKMLPTVSNVKKCLGEFDSKKINIVLAHDPFWFTALAKCGNLIVLSGHNHGGIINIPFIGGVIGSGFHLFPKYTAGIYKKRNSTLFVTKGLGGIRGTIKREINSLTLTQDGAKPKFSVRPFFVLVISLLLVIFGIYYLNSFKAVLPTHAGIASLMALFLGAGVIIILLFKKQIAIFLYTRRKLSLLLRSLVIIYGLFFVLSSCVMLFCINNKPPKGATAIILGCQVNGHSGSLLLNERIATGVKYLKENPDTKVIASGGMGKNEIMAEADFIKSALIADGISPDRIFVENKSKTTKENIKFSKIIIEQNHLSKNIAIITNEFHETRAAITANEYGLKPYSVPAKTQMKYLPYSWEREQFGIAFYAIIR